MHSAFNLSGKIALVTGAGRGIGQACATELAAAGADVVINDLHEAGLEETAAQIRALGRKVFTVASDAFTRQGCQAILDAAVREAGRVDILISSPSYSRRSPFLEYTEEMWDKTLEGCLTGGFHMSQLVARHMVERQIRGKIVFISSVCAVMPMQLSVGYCASKAGLEQMMRNVAMELSPHRINVNAIEPGWIDTPQERLVFGEACMREAGAKLPWGRLGASQDIGRAAVFLSSDAADYVTAVTLPVDGGFRFRDCAPAELKNKATTIPEDAPHDGGPQ